MANERLLTEGTKATVEVPVPEEGYCCQCHAFRVDTRPIRLASMGTVRICRGCDDRLREEAGWTT